MPPGTEKFTEEFQQFQKLTETFGLISSSLDPKTVWEQATQAACDVVDAEAASMFLIDEKSGELFFEIALGLAGHSLMNMRMSKEEGIVGAAVTLGETVISNDVKTDTRFASKVDKESGFDTRNIICSPLISRGQIIGALEALNKKEDHPFTDQDQVLFEALSAQVAISVENSRLYEKLRQAFEQTIFSLVATIEKRDPYTGGHTQRVFLGGVEIAKQLDVDDEFIRNLRMSSLLHDIGKIGIEDSILRKQGHLTDSEYDIMKSHPRLGVEIFGHIDGLKEMVNGVLHHHERYDGRGYPDGLAGEDIPLEARIIAISDTYDAMTSDRPYRKGLSHEIACEEIKKNAGSQFDPKIVDAYFRALEENDFPIANSDKQD